MSPQDRTYMMQTGVPLTDDERRLAIDMHMAAAANIAGNISKLEAELRVLQDRHTAETARIDRLNKDWPNLGPNTILLISEHERDRIIEGMQVFKVELNWTGPETIEARYIPDITTDLAARKNDSGR